MCGDPFQRVGHGGYRKARVDFRGRAGAQQRLDRREVVEDEPSLLIGSSIVVRLSAGYAFEDHGGGCTQEDDGVEARIEASLVRDRP